MKIKRKHLEALLEKWEMMSQDLMQDSPAMGYDEGWRDGKAEGMDTAVGMLWSLMNGNNDTEVCGHKGPREATSTCIFPRGHVDKEHQDDTGGRWLV